MKGWVGLVGWPAADGLPHTRSPVSCRSSARQGKFAGEIPTFYSCNIQLTRCNTVPPGNQKSTFNRNTRWPYRWPCRLTCNNSAAVGIVRSCSLIVLVSGYTQTHTALSLPCLIVTCAKTSAQGIADWDWASTQPLHNYIYENDTTIFYHITVSVHID